MWYLVIVPFFALVVGFATHHHQSVRQEREEMSAETAATNLANHHAAAVRHAAAQPALSGTLDTASIAFPGWYRPVEEWTSVVTTSPRAVVSYPSGATRSPEPLIASGLMRVSDGILGFGRVHAGRIGEVSLPSDIALPDGTPAIVTYLED